MIFKHSLETLGNIYKQKFGNKKVNRDVFSKECKVGKASIQRVGGYSKLLNHLDFTLEECSRPSKSDQNVNLESFREHIKEDKFEQTFSGDSGSVIYVGKHLKTLDELITACEIDLNVWEVERYTTNRWEVALKHENEIHTVPNYQVKAFLKKKALATVDNLIGYFKEQCDKVQRPSVKPLKLKSKQSAKLLEPILQDLHLGKLVWGKSVSGDNYDTETAVRYFISTVEHFIENTSHINVERVLLPIGNDFYNTNDQNYETANKTRLDDDTRWQKSFQRGMDAITQVVDEISKIIPLDLIVVPGNHDEAKSQFLGFALKAYYRSNQNIFIDNDLEKKYFIIDRIIRQILNGPVIIKKRQLMIINRTDRLSCLARIRRFV